MGVLLFLSLIINIGLGSVSIPIRNLINYVFSGNSGNENWNLILTNFRIPKAITAIFVGSALGVSGLQMQTLFRNHHYIFVVEKGTVRIRVPGKDIKKSVKEASKDRIKTKPCWHFVNHPDGCPLPDESCQWIH